ncbi:PREDICTED: uncharacterized protein LOC105556686, partial [Vollenhovia emeryi]|uniref:uncharacterized protein LOC105556686 n=1 Tax=Vollenhovia emeryi TaxID=411798 RepID=UPI0005F4135F
SATERKEFVTSERLCWNCLGRHAVAKCQSSRNCFSCGARHHTLLHDASVSSKPVEASSLTSARGGESGGSVLLATARVLAADRNGLPHAVRVLIDQGSEVSIVSEALAQRLRLPRSRTSLSILGIGESKSGTARGKVSLRLTAQTTGVNLVVEAYVLPRLTLYQGPAVSHEVDWPHIRELPLADPQFASRDPVEILLGAEVCATIFESGLRKGDPHSPLAQKTKLGWILSGGSDQPTAVKHRLVNQCSVDRELSDLVQRFWLQEQEPVSKVPLTTEEQMSEAFFAESHSRTTSGRYMVRLPFTTKPRSLAGTRLPAERLLTAMERKGRNDSRFGSLYREFMREFAELQHMEAVRAPSTQSPGRCYLPHHGVLKEASATTKLRVVFNGSQRTASGESLNGSLHIGANLLPAL